MIRRAIFVAVGSFVLGAVIGLIALASFVAHADTLGTGTLGNTVIASFYAVSATSTMSQGEQEQAVFIQRSQDRLIREQQETNFLLKEILKKL